ncbi:MAG: hypothetical protein A2X61_08245 [Ignavibacteria bacterium GWB2_35_12]|nr:MAG: hypothetical protein A2X61_08245 [Ignavibacteria bacterium GWB2_35_12]OGU92694.1 MAG: hypothetical protein A2220_03805 [Ignavibacteria bacterium RIFOXYA2_FULL_35_10]OGV22446.1 MAG: hypothetical protein A2475_15600 [Ignavibacteria bacterium RIFOXYC2_FULL_35_21]
MNDIQKKYLKHVIYEISNFIEFHKFLSKKNIITRYNKSNKDINNKNNLKNVLHFNSYLNSYLIFLRNLTDFLYLDKNVGISILDFVEKNKWDKIKPDYEYKNDVQPHKNNIHTVLPHLSKKRDELTNEELHQSVKILSLLTIKGLIVFIENIEGLNNKSGIIKLLKNCLKRTEKPASNTIFPISS